MRSAFALRKFGAALFLYSVQRTVCPRCERTCRAPRTQASLASGPVAAPFKGCLKCGHKAHLPRFLSTTFFAARCRPGRRLLENRNFARRRHRSRSRAGDRQGDESRGRARRPCHRMAPAADRQGWARQGRQYAAAVDRGGVVEARRLDHGADRPRRLSAQGSHLGYAAGAQALRIVRRHPAVALLSEHQVNPQGRRHRLPARIVGRHALFGNGCRRRAGIPAERRHHRRHARDHPQGLEPRRARGLRDRAHAQAQEGDRRAQGAGLSASLRHVRRGMPQGGEGISPT